MEISQAVLPLIMGVCVIACCFWMIAHDSSLLSARSYVIIGLAISQIWGIILDLDRLTPDVDELTVFAHYPVRLIIYRLPLVIGSISAVCEMIRRDEKNGRQHTSKWSSVFNRIALRRSHCGAFWHVARTDRNHK